MTEELPEVCAMETRRGRPGRYQRLLCLLGILLVVGAGGIATPGAQEDPVPPEQSDINRDGTVNENDLYVFQKEWHASFATVGDLIPIKVGNYWRYNTHYQEYRSSAPDPISDQIEISVRTTQNTSAFPGKTAIVFRYRSLLVGASERNVYMERKNGAYWLLGESPIYPAGTQLVKYDPPEIWMQGPAYPGRIWVGSAVQDTGGVTAVATSSYETDEAQVVTSAGTFTNCTKMVRSEVGTEGPKSYQATETQWFKPGVGMVKAEYHRSWTSAPIGVTETLDHTFDLYNYYLQP